jgi:uncharacterized protein YdeI (YjbR/CyaY-like superfamily)
MKLGETLFVENRNKWREWLSRNFDKEKEVWIIYYKKHTGKLSIPYDDAVEEALCFGWIDGKVRSIDSQKYMQRYSPRSPDSVWSLLNKKRVQKMIKEDKMTQAGLKLVKFAKKSGKWQAAYSSKTKPGLPPDLKIAFEKNSKAHKNFNKFSNSQQLAYIFWVLSAKRKETRETRIKVVVERSSKNLKLLQQY